MKKVALVGLMLFTLLPLASAVTLETGTIINPTDSNTTYTLGNTMSFSNVIIGNNSLYFNDSIFKIEPDSGIASVTINTLTSFNVTATDNVTFILGGFTINTDYDIKVDDIVWSVVTANITGVLSFNYSSWSVHTFSIVLHSAGLSSGDSSRRRTTPSEPEPSEIPSPERPDYTLFWLILAIIIIILTIFIVAAVKRKKIL